jgi:hypothetical protein
MWMSNFDESRRKRIVAELEDLWNRICPDGELIAGAGPWWVMYPEAAAE